MIIKINLFKSLIIESVKNETYHVGQLDKASEPSTVAQAFHEQAGDALYHERMLERSFNSAHAELTTQLADFLPSVGDDIADNTIETNENGDCIEMLLSVSDRFNKGLIKSLAKLCSKYIEESMLVDWWKPTDEKKSSHYLVFLQKDLASIKLCFSKTSPAVPVYQYPTAIVLRYPIITSRNGIPGNITDQSEPGIMPEILYGNPWIVGRGDESEISYTLVGENGKMPVDDVVVRVDNPCCKACLTNEGKWCVRGMALGYTVVTLFSRHNDKVFNKFAVRVV